MSTKMIGLLCLLNSVTVDASSKSFVNSIWKDSNLHLEKVKSNQHNNRGLFEKKNHVRGLLKRRHFSFVSDGDIQKHRKGEEEFEEQFACDQSFLQCLPDDKCNNCFGDLYTEEIDWTSVTADTGCYEVIDILAGEGHCEYLKDESEDSTVSSMERFCKTFTACAIWNEDDLDEDWGPGEGDNGFALETEGDYGDGTINGTKIDCDKLEKCEWPGSHAIFKGDGICHDALPGCYNHKICDYDGGDCCKDTCKDSTYAKCGSEGYTCKDPESTFFEKIFKDAVIEKKSLPECGDDEAIYRLVMHDSFGDGWDGTKITVKSSFNSNDIKFNGGLENGEEGTEYMCLNKDSTCYHVSVSGGTWGKEISWEIKPYKIGAPAIAEGGSPMDCDFSAGGDACEKTCNGKPDVPQKAGDIDYEDFQQMSECINSKCIIQVAKCESNPQCAPCMDEDIKDFCYGMDDFVAVVDCTLCQCTSTERDDHCMSKAAPGMVVPPEPREGRGEHGGHGGHGGPRHCSAAETREGSNAVRVFSGCSNLEEVGMMVTNFDNNHFGDLDTFESCSHSYAQKDDHGGHTALGCMQILVNSMNANIDMSSNDDIESPDYKATPVEAIAAVSKMLYHNASSFCDCASDASNKCPLCRSFMHFKTLMYEVVDACQSLDEIDCAAWEEFSTPCKANIEKKFGEIDFRDEDQCQFVHDTCGGAGPFPAFRRLDCDSEIPSASWDFWNLFRKSCLGKEVKNEKSPTKSPVSSPVVKPSSNTRPVPAPTKSNTRPVPVPATSKPVSKSTPKPYNPPEKTEKKPLIFASESKPYYPPESSSSSSSSSSSKAYVPPEERGSTGKKYVPPEEKKKHWFRNFILLCLLGGGAYIYYKRRTDQFAFVRYRSVGGGYRTGGESEMYSSLAMESGSSSFEPPTLPPTPSAI